MSTQTLEGQAMPEDQLIVFISWSGVRAGKIADALKAWLDIALPDTRCFLSRDIGGGKRWNRDLSEALQSSNFGILVLTAENKNADWILFEAGALAKQVGESHVVPLLVDIEPQHLSGPLADFQALRLADQAFDLLKAVNGSLPDPVSRDVLQKKFDWTYEKFSNSVRLILNDRRQEKKQPDPNSITQQMLEEILRIVKSLPEVRNEADAGHIGNEKFYPTNDRIDLYKFLKRHVPVREFRNASMPALFEAAAKFVVQIDPTLDQDAALTVVARHLISDRPLRDLLGALEKYQSAQSIELGNPQ